MNNKGAWVELNKSIYLQNANGDEIYKYVKSEGIPLKPNKLTATKDNQEVQFKVWFQKVKSGTRAVNVIERARPIADQLGTNHFFNYYNVSLTKSGPAERRVITDVVLTAPQPSELVSETIVKDSTTAVGNTIYPPLTTGSDMINSFAPMMSSMYTSVVEAQLKMYSKPEVTAQMARVTKNYYDALIKVGFSEEAALKIITSKPLISMDGKQ